MFSQPRDKSKRSYGSRPRGNGGSPPPVTPTGLTVTSKTNGIDLSFNAPSSGCSINIYRDDVKIGYTTGTSFSDGSAQPRVIYNYKISQTNGQAESNKSDPVAGNVIDLSVAWFQAGASGGILGDMLNPYPGPDEAVQGWIDHYTETAHGLDEILLYNVGGDQFSGADWRLTNFGDAGARTISVDLNNSNSRQLKIQCNQPNKTVKIFPNTEHTIYFDDGGERLSLFDANNNGATPVHIGFIGDSSRSYCPYNFNGLTIDSLDLSNGTLVGDGTTGLDASNANGADGINGSDIAMDGGNGENGMGASPGGDGTNGTNGNNCVSPIYFTNSHIGELYVRGGVGGNGGTGGRGGDANGGNGGNGANALDDGNGTPANGGSGGNGGNAGQASDGGQGGFGGDGGSGASVYLANTRIDILYNGSVGGYGGAGGGGGVAIPGVGGAFGLGVNGGSNGGHGTDGSTLGSRNGDSGLSGNQGNSSQGIVNIDPSSSVGNILQ